MGYLKIGGRIACTFTWYGATFLALASWVRESREKALVNKAKQYPKGRPIRRLFVSVRVTEPR
jgi:hypothetical protein